MATGSRLRKQVRLSVNIPTDYAELVPGQAVAALERKGVTRDLSAGGVCLAVDRPPAIGSYLRLNLRPESGPELLGMQATVVRVEPEKDGATYLVGLRFVAPRQDDLHALLFHCSSEAPGVETICAEIRHCGGLKNDCPAATAGLNCWQVDKAPCCHWQNHRDCVRCPVTMLAFLE